MALIVHFMNIETIAWRELEEAERFLRLFLVIISAITGYLVMLAMFSTFTYYPPKIFLFENYFGYEYSGEYGILEDYEPYRVFRKE